jgi:hypothetical protein
MGFLRKLTLSNHLIFARRWCLVTLTWAPKWKKNNSQFFKEKNQHKLILQVMLSHPPTKLHLSIPGFGIYGTCSEELSYLQSEGDHFKVFTPREKHRVAADM